MEPNVTSTGEATPEAKKATPRKRRKRVEPAQYDPSKFSIMDPDTYPEKGDWFECGAQSFDGKAPPQQNIVIGGVNFPTVSFDESPQIIDGMVSYTKERNGQRHYLFPEDLEAIRDELTREDPKRVTVVAGGTSFRISRTGVSRLHRMRKGSSTPLYNWCYIRPCEEPALVNPLDPAEYPSGHNLENLKVADGLGDDAEVYDEE